MLGRRPVLALASFVLVTLPILIFGTLAAVPASAQQPRSLAEVLTIRVAPSPDEPSAMSDALVRELEKSGTFRLVLNNTDPADAILSPLYGCSTITGEYLPEAQRRTMRALCEVSLIDPKAEDENGVPLTIWSIPVWRVNEFYSAWDNEWPGQAVRSAFLQVNGLWTYSEPELRDWAARYGLAQTVQEYIAAGVVVELLRDRDLALRGQTRPPISTHTLREVRTIFVSRGDYTNESAADKFMEDLMGRTLEKWVEVKANGKKKQTLVGDSLAGVESVLPGVRQVFTPAKADAILIGPYTHSHAGPAEYVGTGHATTTINSDGTTADTDVQVAVEEHQRIIEVGTAVLFDRRTQKTIWSSTQNDYQWWVGVLAGGSNTGPVTVVDKLVKQLRKDYEK